MSYPHTFSGNPLDRADAMRRDEASVAEAANHADSRYLLLWNLNVLTIADPAGPQLGWLSQADIARLGIDLPPILLGLDGGVPHFALDVSALGDPMHELNLGPPWQFDDARRAAMGLPEVPGRGHHGQVVGVRQARGQRCAEARVTGHERRGDFARRRGEARTGGDRLEYVRVAVCR